MFSSPSTFRFACLAAAVLAFASSCTPPPTASHSLTFKDVAMDKAKGTLFIIGGGNRPLSLMDGVVNRMASKDDLVVVLPMASSEPEESLVHGIRPFEELGCTNVHGMNLQPGTFGEAQLDSLRNARAFYLCGGDQARFMAVADGAIQEAICHAYVHGAIVSGSSAGAAMMSRVMITGDQVLEPDYESTYRRLKADNAIYGEGLGLLPGAIVDQHFVERSRHNRALTALHDHPGLPVFGIGESTALVVEPEGLSVEGSGQVVVFSPSQTSADTAGNIRIDATTVTVLVAGDRWPGK